MSVARPEGRALPTLRLADIDAYVNPAALRRDGHLFASTNDLRGVTHQV